MKKPSLIVGTSPNHLRPLKFPPNPAEDLSPYSNTGALYKMIHMPPRNRGFDPDDCNSLFQEFDEDFKRTRKMPGLPLHSLPPPAGSKRHSTFPTPKANPTDSSSHPPPPTHTNSNKNFLTHYHSSLPPQTQRSSSSQPPNPASKFTQTFLIQKSPKPHTKSPSPSPRPNQNTLQNPKTSHPSPTQSLPHQNPYKDALSQTHQNFKANILKKFKEEKLSVLHANDYILKSRYLTSKNFYVPQGKL